MPLRVTTWNIQNAQRLITDNPSVTEKNRRKRIQETIQAIDPDILCIQEGPVGEQAISDFCAQILNSSWVPVLLHQDGEALGTRDRDYKIRGTQWIWFLVRDSLANKCQLQYPAVWQSFTKKKTWEVNFWGKLQARRHSHYRHPQVLVYDLGNGQAIEFIGVHLKSKINLETIERDDEGNLIGDYVHEALEARIKLASEARNIRDYISEKFQQLAQPAIVVLGDCNDGPGQDYFETQYLFFDLISNLQGEVLLAERFFNHALFDLPSNLRWTARYRDQLLDIPASRNPLLIDHILVSQPLTRGEVAVVVEQRAGTVEHEAFERANAGSNSKTRTSDHRPVTCKFSDTPKT